MKWVRLLWNVFLLQFVFSAVVFVVAGTTSPLGNNRAESTTDTDVQNASADGSSVSVSSPHEVTDTSGLQNEEHSMPDETLQITEIHSSFGEVTKSSAPEENDAVNDRPRVVLNQGSTNKDVSDLGTITIMSSTDSASAELKNRVISLSTDLKGDGNAETSSTKNVTNDNPPPIVILPPGMSDSSTPGKDPQTEPSSQTSSSSEYSQNSELSEPPVVRAEPKVVSQPTETDTEEDLGTLSVGGESSGVNIKAPEITTPVPPTNSIDLVDVPTSESPHEEIPSFSEWTQKQLEEAEKKKGMGQNKTSSPSPTRVGAPSKVRSKNYASPDCGAKIVTANPEAENPSGVLSNSKDEYVLNKCTTQRKWLIIELCEAIQAKKLELANFELFSSSPKDFSVSVSHNYPSREWSSVGQFTARDERVAQSFNLHPHLFGKYLKVEFNTHYGNEHFCCTSQVRVFGTSEFEVLETESEVPEIEDGEEDEDELPIGVDMGKPAKNLFGHATEAVYSIVKKAAEALVKSGDRREEGSFLKEQNFSVILPEHSKPPAHCTTLRYLVVCNNCSEFFFDKVYNLLSCRPREMQALIETPFVFDGINSSQLCSIYGLDFILKRNGPVPLRIKHEDQLDHAGYLAAMLPAEYISALCNILAVLEGKVVLNDSHSVALEGIDLTIRPPQDTRDLGFKKLVIEPEVAPTCSMEKMFSSSLCKSRDSKTDGIGMSTSSPDTPGGASQYSTIASMIKPTKTLSKEDNKIESVKSSGETVSVHIPILSPEAPFVVEPSHITVQPSVVDKTVIERKSSSTDSSSSSVPPTIISEIPPPEQPLNEPLVREPDSGDSFDSASAEDHEHSKDLDAIIQEMKELDNNEDITSDSSQSSGGPTPPSSVVTQTRVPPQQAQKESVFVRLQNRIKALERNMSLSGQYLEELSRRYKKQEELSRALNKTLVLLHEEVRRSREKEIQHDNDLSFLKAKVVELAAVVESLHTERDSWQQKAAVVSQHLIVIAIEVVLFGVVLWVCRRLPSDSLVTPPQRKISSMFYKVNKPHGKLKRRSSFEETRGPKQLRKRRPSEELLYISGSYQDLHLKSDKVVVVEGVDMSPGVDTSSWSAVSSRDQRRKRKRRKNLFVKSSSSENLAQLTSVSSGSTRKISAPSHSFSLSTPGSYEDTSVPEPIKNTVVPRSPSSSQSIHSPKIRETDVTSHNQVCRTGNGVSKDIVNTFPTFMETASSVRSRRSFNFGESQSTHPALNTSVHVWNTGNGHDGESESSVSHQSSQSRGLDDKISEHTSSQSDGQDASAIRVAEKKKTGKKGGFKNMVKKFF